MSTDPAENLNDLGTPGEEAGKIARATGLMGGLTLASRILGLARDVAQAAVLGTGTAADAFTLAFIIPNTLRRLFGENTTGAAFVPTYVEILGKESRERAFEFGNRILTLVGVILLAIVLLGIACAPLLVRIFAPGFSSVPGKMDLAAGLLRVLFPYILAVGLAAVAGGILNAHRHFAAPAAAPILFNISALFGILFLSRLMIPDEPVWGYSVGIVLGGFFQLMIMIPPLRARGFRFKPDFQWNSPEVKRVGLLALPALVGLVAAEVNMVVDKMIASMLEPGSVAALAYGNRMMQFPQGVISVSLATALLPTLSRQVSAKRLDDAGKTLGTAMLALAALMIPATLCAIVLAGPAVAVVLGRGAFSAHSIDLTAAALAYYSAGLLFYGAVKITIPFFYSMKDTVTPVKIAVICMGINIPLNVILTSFFLKTGLDEPLAGLALATSISSMLNLLMLRRTLKKKVGPVVKSSSRAWLAMLPAAAVSLGVLLLLSPWASSLSNSFSKGLPALLVASAAAYVSFFLVFLFAGGRAALSVFRTALRR